MLKILYLCLLLTIANCAVVKDKSSSDSSSSSSSSESSEDPADLILGDNHEASRSAIYGGDFIDVTKANYIAQLIQNGFLNCGGTIISQNHIITAAHCISRPIRINKYTIITGSKYRGQGGHATKVKSIKVHEDYDSESFDNDIALITLKSPLTFDSTQDALPIINKKVEFDNKVTISGFGREGSSKGTSALLKSGVIKVAEKKKCTRFYQLTKHPKPLTDNQFCAGHGYPDTCQGDSGGPVVVDGFLAGVVSFGLQCEKTTIPGVYTEVFNYRGWIAKHSGLQL